MLNRFTSLAGALALALAALPTVAAAAEVDIKRGVPDDVHMAVYGKDNPERDYQWEYFEEVWQTFKQERIGQRIVELIGSRMPQDKQDEAKDAWNKFKEAVKPFELGSLEDLEEVVFAQHMVGPFSHNLVLLRLPEDAAKGLEEAVVNVFGLAEGAAEGKLKVAEREVGEVTVTSLEIPGDCPMTPAIGRVGDIVVFCTYPALLDQSIEQLTGGEGKSKFDDPRLQAALKELPEAEDSIVFFDGKAFFKSLAGVADFIRQEKPDDEDATRIARVFDQIIEHAAILDYEVAVEYTADGQNRQAAIGKLVDDADQKVLGQALMGQEPFEEWQSWIPADATAYSLCTGADAHVIYENLMNLIENEFPEAEEGLRKFAEAQEKIDLHLDEDILQNFSGECVSVTVPVGEGSSAAPQTVVALKVNDADKLRSLINRGFEALDRIPAVQAQGVALGDDQDLEGFQQIKANIFAAIGVKPVIGFNDGWMIVSSHVDAAKKVLEARAGDAETLDAEETLDAFGIESADEVYLVGYSDVGDGIRKAADFVDQIGTWAMVFGGAALANAPEKDAETIREALGLLPSIAKVIRKFDYLEDRLTVVQEGPDDNTYRRDTVINVRQPDENDDEGDDDEAGDSESEEVEEAEEAEAAEAR